MVVNNGSSDRGKKAYTVLLYDPNTDYREKFKTILEGENCTVIASPSLEELIEHLDQGDILIAAAEQNTRERLSQVRAQHGELPILALARANDISTMMRADSVDEVIPYPPSRNYLVSRIKHYRTHWKQKKVMGMLSPESDVIVNAMFDDLENKRVDQCMEKAYYLCREFEGDDKVSSALFDLLRAAVKRAKASGTDLEIHGVELNAISTDAFYSAYDHPLIMKAFGGCFKRYFEKRRAKCDLLFLVELEKRHDEHVSASGAQPEVSLLHSKKTDVSTVRLKSKKLLDKDGEIYIHMEYVNGPNLNSIAPEIKEAIGNDDVFARHFARAVRFYMNETLAALQANPISLPKVSRKKQEYYHGIRDMFTKVAPYLRMGMSENDHHALRTAIKAYLEPLLDYEPVQYFDMCAKNIMFEIGGAYNSTFDDVKNFFRKWRGKKNRAEITLTEVIEYVKDVTKKVDWNKTFRTHHAADDARHETPSLPMSLEDSDMLNMHMLAVKEKEKLIKEQLEKVGSCADYRLASPKFSEAFMKIDGLDKIAGAIERGEIDCTEAGKVLRSLLSADSFNEFEKYQRAVPAAWLYRAMRTFGLTLLDYLPSERKQRIDARRRMASCYVDREAKRTVECGKNDGDLEEKIAEIVVLSGSPDRRPFVGGRIFIPHIKADGEKYIIPEKLEDYVNAANDYFQSYTNTESLKDEMSFCLKRMQLLLDERITHVPESLAGNDGSRLTKSVNDSGKYFSFMRRLLKTYENDEEVKQYAGALYLRRFLDGILGSKGIMRVNYVPRRDAS